MTDKPRMIVVCHPDDFAVVNEAVMKMRLGDVLVRPNCYVEVGMTYVIDMTLDDWKVRAL